MTRRDPWADAPAEMTVEEFKRRLAEQRSGSKYGNVPTEVDGIRFASRTEAERYGELLWLVRDGQISDLCLQPRYKLPGGITYVGDFAYTEAGRQVCEDVKGLQTGVFRLKWKLMRETYPDIELRIVER